MWTYSLGLLIICHLANFTVITKKQSLTTGSTEVQTCPTAWPVLIAHACMGVRVCVCANFIDKNYARLGDKEIWPHVSQLDSAKNQRTTLKQRTEQGEGEGEHRRKVNCHRLHAVSLTVFGLICCHNGSIRQSAMLTVSGVNGNAACSCLHCWPTAGCIFSKGFTCGQRGERWHLRNPCRCRLTWNDASMCLLNCIRDGNR